MSELENNMDGTAELTVDQEAALLAEDFGMVAEAPVQVRDIGVITEEIVFYKRQAGGAIIEIGKRLNEAKAQLRHGEWLPWLREKVDISERSATNFMRLAREYSQSAEIADLGATKALALLDLPASERQSFAAEKHVVNGAEKSVSDMTAEELKQAIRERDEALSREEQAQGEARQAQRELETAQDSLRSERAKLDAMTVQRDQLQKKLENAKDKEQKARAALENARQELKELREKPVEVAVEQVQDQEALQAAREEGAAQAKKEAEAGAGEQVKQANAKLMEAQARLDAAERETRELRKQLAAADQDTMAFKLYFDEWQHKYNAMMGALQAVEGADPEKAGKLRGAIRAVLEKWGAA